jgi:hypothetical protein
MLSVDMPYNIMLSIAIFHIDIVIILNIVILSIAVIHLFVPIVMMLSITMLNIVLLIV